MSNTQPVDCFLSKSDGSDPISVQALLVHHEVLRLPQAWALVTAGALKLGEGPFVLSLRGASDSSGVQGLAATNWYVNEITQLWAQPSGDGLGQWLLRLGAVKSQNVPRAALLSEGKTASDILTQLCEHRELLQVQWAAGKPHITRLGSVMSLGETLEGFLRRFAQSLNSWFVYAGKDLLRWSQDHLLSLAGAGQRPLDIAAAAVRNVAAPAEVRQYWGMSLAKEPLANSDKASSERYVHDVMHSIEIDTPTLKETARRAPAQWNLHYGLSDQPEHFAASAGQAIERSEQVALSVVHIWRPVHAGQAVDPGMGGLFEGLIGGLLPDQLAHFLSQSSHYAVLTLSVDQASRLRAVEGALLIEQYNLRDVARTLGERLHLGMVAVQPPVPVRASPMPATVLDATGNYTKDAQDDHAALPALGQAPLRSSRLKIRFDWSDQALEVPYASAWGGAGGTVFFPPRAGDRVLVQFMGDDWSSPVVTAALVPEFVAAPVSFKSKESPLNVRHPQGISARDGLMLETTESGDMVLYAKQGNLVLRARDTVLLQGRVLDERFARTTSSGKAYNEDDDE